jgi:ADP-heptose:LPS heptosyltransferase
VIRLRSLGDSVLTTPALALLKQFRHDLRVAVIVEDRFRAVFEGNPHVDEILPPAFSSTARWKADLCLNLHGGTRSIALTAASRARFRAGFGHFRASALYNIRIPRAQLILGVDRPIHTAEHLASAVFYLGVPVVDIPPARLYMKEEPARRWAANQGIRPTAVVHPAASAPEKTWPAERFIAIADYIDSQLGVEPVFVAATAEELQPFRKHRCVAGAPLAAIKELLACATLFVGNDSGPAHMAAAFGLPVVVLFGASDPRIWAPWKTPSEVLFCAGGISGITVPQAIGALERLRVKA